MILQMSMKESSSSRTLNSLFLILSLNDFFGISLRELGISFHYLAPILEKATKQQSFQYGVRISMSWSVVRSDNVINHLKLKKSE